VLARLYTHRCSSRLYNYLSMLCCIDSVHGISSLMSFNNLRLRHLLSLVLHKIHSASAFYVIFTLICGQSCNCQIVIGCFVSCTKCNLLLDCSNPLLQSAAIASSAVFVVWFFIKPTVSCIGHDSSFWTHYYEIPCNNRDLTKKVPWQYLVSCVQFGRNAIMVRAV